MSDMDLNENAEEENACDCGCARVLTLDSFMTDYDMDEFNKGVCDASYLAGFFISLVDAGVTPADAVTLLSNRLVLDHEKFIAKENNQAALHIAALKSNDLDEI